MFCQGMYLLGARSLKTPLHEALLHVLQPMVSLRLGSSPLGAQVVHLLGILVRSLVQALHGSVREHVVLFVRAGLRVGLAPRVLHESATVMLIKPAGPEFIVSEGLSTKVDQPLTSNPNVGG